MTSRRRDKAVSGRVGNTHPSGARAAKSTPAPATEPLAARLGKLIGQPWMQTLVIGPLGSVLLILIGLHDSPKRVPLADFIGAHPLPTLLIAAIILIIAVATVVIHSRLHVSTQRPSGGAQPGRWMRRALVLTTTLATFSTSGLVILASTVLVRPSWCPAVLCVQPAGPHDANLEAGLTAVQSADFVIAGDPSAYSTSRLPQSQGPGAVAAHLVSQGNSASTAPYQVVVRVHSLQTGTFGMLIEGVQLHMVRVSAVPTPLRVWHKGQALQYQTNPYSTVYTDQSAGSLVAAVYAGRVVEGRVQLAPGESDELSIGLETAHPVELSFDVRVMYRVDNETVTRTLALPYVLTVAFSDALNWQRYELLEGRLVPA